MVAAGGQNERPLIAVSMGDPGGIGPEVLVKALADPALRSAARYRIMGMSSPMHAAADRAGIDPFWWRISGGSDMLSTTDPHDVVLIDYEDEPRPTGWRAEPNKPAGEASFRFVEEAIALARRKSDDPLRADAIVTGPISKAAWDLAGRGKYPGHTELLATRFNAKRVAMMFVAPTLRVVLVSAHVPLMDLQNVLTIGRVHEAIDLGSEACARLGVERPRVAVCGLNPHAGEGGLLGDEETRLIEPAIELAVRSGIDASGPFPADTIFNHALAGRYDLVVAMYHDQGLIPVKLLSRDSAVNVTLGLPTVRTSPDHGTAFDIAGRNEADPGSTIEAIRLAVRMARTQMVGGRQGLQ